MDQSAWLGLVVGAMLGGAYAWFQLRSLRRGAQQQPTATVTGLMTQLPAAIARLGFLVIVMVLLLAAPGEKINKWWLTGSLALFYSVPLFWRLRRLIAEKR